MAPRRRSVASGAGPAAAAGAASGAAAAAAGAAAALAPIDALDLLPLATSLLAVPVSAALNALPAAREPLGLFAIALGVLGAVLLLPRALRPLGLRPAMPRFYALFSLFAFTSVVDGAMALTAAGLTTVSAFYLESGEAYLASPHGAAINAWDGTYHLFCYVVFAAVARRGGAALQVWWLRGLAYTWAGSVLFSLAVLLPGVAIGSYAADVKPSILLNALYIAVPVAWCATVDEAGGPAAQPIIADFRVLAAPPSPLVDSLQTLLNGVSRLAVGCLVIVEGLAAAGAPAFAARPGARRFYAAQAPYVARPEAFPRVQAVLLAVLVAPALLAYGLATVHVALAMSGLTRLHNGIGKWLLNNAHVFFLLTGALWQCRFAAFVGTKVACSVDPAFAHAAQQACAVPVWLGFFNGVFGVYGVF
jgi:hypothetical protein